MGTKAKSIPGAQDLIAILRTTQVDTDWCDYKGKYTANLGMNARSNVH